MPADTRRSLRLAAPPGWRLEPCGEQIYRLWRDDADRPAAAIVGGYNTWTARPIGTGTRARYAWETPTLREALAAVIAHLEASRAT
ncbi:hypothetical protein BBK14_11320 [Parafrankia soli]|uniref:Uncharacterized protein n=1 Tax=Parafrankia soli TaxID=2599596 RepID=A0A1S1RBQ4_9ACTN|nr:hypothetical protein [Parafrankia soli]OHV42204.1 hypothetical protein BBK14_11320 [Parafrankia soli]